MRPHHYGIEEGPVPPAVVANNGSTSYYYDYPPPTPMVVEDDLKSVDSIDMEPALTDDIYSLMTITNVRLFAKKTP